MYHIYCDASIEPINPGGVLAWAYVVHHDGKHTYKDVRIEGWGDRFTNNMGEYMAVVGAMLWLIRLPPEKHEPVILRSDSQLVINQCSGRWGCRNPQLKKYHKLILEAQQRYTKNIRFHWIPREQNKEADALSRSLYTEKMFKVLEDNQLELTFGDDDLPF